MASANPLPLSGSSQALRAIPGRYRGYSIRETAGAAAVVRFYDHASAASGTIVETISLAANESTSDYLGGDDGIVLSAGLYVQIVSGAVEGSVRFG